MLFQQKFVITESQKGLLYKDHKFVKVLDAGKYYFWSANKAYELKLAETIGVNREIVSEEILLAIASHASEFAAHVVLWETCAEEIGLIYEQNLLKDIKFPSQHGAFWQGVREIRVEKINISQDFSVSQRMAALMLGAESATLRQSANKAIFAATILEDHIGFLEIDGKVSATLNTGTYAWWRFSRMLAVKQFDMRLQNMEVNGQEILTKDKVSLRINLSATWQIANANLVRHSLVDHNDYLYREMQLALRTVVSTQTLDQLLTDKNLLNSQVKVLVSTKAQEYGINVKTVGARDIVLPGEMKSILAQVVEAERIAEANLIKRREETQATRSLHNTAKVIENNPVLLRLKELEILEKISGRINTLNVYGGLESVMNDMVKLANQTSGR